jgi:serine O-acetyltransferase
MDTLFIEAKEIGGGLYIQHGFSTMIAAESIGENCWINQQVTIGYKDNTRAPVIGDDVMITCGAKVLGNITVGNGAIIGANAVVVKDVAPNAVMGGIPAKVLKWRSEDDNQ